MLTSKFGFVSYTGREGLASGAPNVKAAVQGSLKRLGTDDIDLYPPSTVTRPSPL
ncbi:hypothetical protein [Streptomyces lutosisoli]|uniref:Uncharacterized protein n=1 Tax=Streptomyces lutosisoli TaxID=2665721 RepID=A0ABW2VV11_9ACTN